MSLICCLAKEPGCICEVDKICGGIHIINGACEVVHAKVQTRCQIHEIGVKPIATVVSSSSAGDPSRSM